MKRTLSAAAFTLAVLTILTACATVGPASSAESQRRGSSDSRVSSADAAATPSHTRPAPSPASAEESVPTETAAASDPRPEKPVEPAPDGIETRVGRLAASMSVEEKVGQLLMIAVEDPHGHRELAAVDGRFSSLFERVRPGGVILFGDNIVTVPQTIALIDKLQNMSRIPLFVATDEEGGLVSRLTASGKIPATPVPSAWTIGKARDPRLAYRAGTVIGRELSALGLNMDLAPDADVLTNPANRVIGTRSFGSNAAKVATMVAAMVRGIQDEGVSAVIKHFPGHGDTANDTHVSAAIVYHDRARLDAVELVPFEHGIAAGVDAVMTAHIGLPEVTGSDTPATLSPRVVEGILRHDLGFQGVVFTDAMNMAALEQYASPKEAAVEAILAGCDILLRPTDALVAYDALLSAVKSGRISAQRLDASVNRILGLKYKRHLLEGSGTRPSVSEAMNVLGSPAHRSVMKQIVEEAKLHPDAGSGTASR